MFNRDEYSETMYLIICSTLSVLSAASCHVHKSWGVHAAVTFIGGFSVFFFVTWSLRQISLHR